MIASKLTDWNICAPAADPAKYAIKTTVKTTVRLVLPATLVVVN
jgi:hypothetical protein